jgi:nickel-dependent lactate racemase
MAVYGLRESGDSAIYHDALEDVEVRVPRQACLGLVGVREPAAVSWPEDFREAFAAPHGARPLDELARGACRVAIIVSDPTRGVPTATVMPMLLAGLRAAGVERSAVTVVVARGVHRCATASEIEEIVGADSLAGVTVMNHDPYDRTQLVPLGTTSAGTPVEVNRTVYDADLRIAVGKVEPHEFAGFSGGRKSVLPGVAGEKTIEVNHRPEMLLSPGARPGELETNPIHLDMLEAAALLPIHFMVNLVVNQAGETAGVFTGDPVASHLAAVAFLRRFCQVTLAERPDIIVTTPGHPLHIDFYQSIKPLIALAPLVEAGAVLVLYSACRDGLGTEDMLVPYEGARDIETVIARLKRRYRIQMDHALLLGKILQRGIRLVVASPNVDAAILRKLFLTPAPNPQEALETARKLSGTPHPRILFFPQAQRALCELAPAPRA